MGVISVIPLIDLTIRITASTPILRRTVQRLPIPCFSARVASDGVPIGFTVVNLNPRMAWFTELCASIEAVVPEAGSVRSNLVCVPVVKLGDLLLERILSLATRDSSR